MGDLDGHRYATNVGEPILYPEMAKKFGAVVTYEDSPSRHLKTEFGFDVLEVARANFAPQAYHDFIGFYVSKDLLQRAFYDTYGLDLKDLFFSFDLAISSYRSAVSRTIPLATRVAWAQRKDEIKHVEPGATHRKFVYIMKRSSYEKEWGKRRDEPNRLEKFLAWILKLIPPIGPLQALRLKMPTPPVEQLFMASFDRAVQQYTSVLDEEPAFNLFHAQKYFVVRDGLANGSCAVARRHHPPAARFPKSIFLLTQCGQKVVARFVADRVAGGGNTLHGLGFQGVEGASDTGFVR